MTNIILSGCQGHMGKTVASGVATREGVQIVAGVDIAGGNCAEFPVYMSFDEIMENGDVIIDFSNANALESILEYAKRTNTPCVLCSTGYSAEQIDLINRFSEEVAIFRSANMSLGINLLSELVKTAARVLGESFDIEIVEAHHNLKLDAPSGTALMLEKSVEDGLNYTPELVYDRHQNRKKRDKKEIGMHSIRGGTIVGEHEVIFAGTDEIITISHSARSKSVFAAGAIDAAIFMNGKSSGLYDMSNVIK